MRAQFKANRHDVDMVTAEHKGMSTPPAADQKRIAKYMIGIVELMRANKQDALTTTIDMAVDCPKYPEYAELRWTVSVRASARTFQEAGA